MGGLGCIEIVIVVGIGLVLVGIWVRRALRGREVPKSPEDDEGW